MQQVQKQSLPGPEARQNSTCIRLIMSHETKILSHESVVCGRHFTKARSLSSSTTISYGRTYMRTHVWWNWPTVVHLQYCARYGPCQSEGRHANIPSLRTPLLHFPSSKRYSSYKCWDFTCCYGACYTPTCYPNGSRMQNQRNLKHREELLHTSIKD